MIAAFNKTRIIHSSNKQQKCCQRRGLEGDAHVSVTQVWLVSFPDHILQFPGFSLINYEFINLLFVYVSYS